MGRSPYKKGPFTDGHLDEKVEALNAAQREESDPDVVAALDDPAGVRGAHASPCTTGRSSSRCT